MKLRNVIGITVVAVAIIGAYNANNTRSTELSDLQMENVEMLADAQEPGFPSYCMGSNHFCSDVDGSHKTGYRTCRPCN